MSAPRGALARALALALAGSLAGPAAQPADAYLKLGSSVDGRTVSLTWTRTPVRYFVNDRASVPGVGVAEFRDAVARGFDTWQQVASASIAFEFAGFTAGEPLDLDDRNTVGFLARPELERTLAATSFLIDTRTGEILESDIYFNTRFPWSVAPGGESGRYDVQTIATHEAGHLLGLGHSALGETELRPGGGRRVIASEAVMFPIAFSAGSVAQRELDADDVAGVSDLYPAGRFRAETGSISGRVTKGGRGFFGAHVVAFNPRTGTLVSGFSLDDDGRFVIAGLERGTYVLRVEPLDDADVSSFFDTTRPVEVDFKVTFASTLVVVPRGGSSARVEIAVAPK